MVDGKALCNAMSALDIKSLMFITNDTLGFLLSLVLYKVKVFIMAPAEPPRWVFVRVETGLGNYLWNCHSAGSYLLPVFPANCHYHAAVPFSPSY